MDSESPSTLAEAAWSRSGPRFLCIQQAAIMQRFCWVRKVPLDPSNLHRVQIPVWTVQTESAQCSISILLGDIGNSCKSPDTCSEQYELQCKT